MGRSLHIDDYRKAMVKLLECISGQWEEVFRTTPGNHDVIQSGDDLVPIMDSEIGPKRNPIISQSHPELDLLTWPHRIRGHIEILHGQRTHTHAGQCPPLRNSSGTEPLHQVDRLDRPLNIYDHGKTMF